MEKEFVTYELAVRMKALGFSEVCFTYFIDGFIQPALNPKDYTYFKEMSEINKNMLNYQYVLAPTWQSAFRWFRDNYFMYHQIFKGYGWEGIIRESNNTESILWHDGTYNTYEEAELECVKKLIEIVEQKEK